MSLLSTGALSRAAKILSLEEDELPKTKKLGRFGRFDQIAKKALQRPEEERRQQGTPHLKRLETLSLVGRLDTLHLDESKNSDDDSPRSLDLATNGHHHKAVRQEKHNALRQKPEERDLDVSIRAPKKHLVETHYSYGKIKGKPVEGLMLCVKSGIPANQCKYLKIFTLYREPILKAGTGIGLTAFMNGITVDEKTFKKYGKSVYESIQRRIPVIGLHNQTYGAIGDLISLIAKKTMPISTASIKLMKRFLKTLAAHFYADKGSIKAPVSVLLVVHSEGGLILERTYEKLDKSVKRILKNHLFIIALGSVSPIPRKRGHSAHRDISTLNIYSQEDFAAMPFLASYYAKRDKYNIKIVPCETHSDKKILWVIDHAFLAKTYQNQLQAQIGVIEKRVGIG